MTKKIIFLFAFVFTTGYMEGQKLIPFPDYFLGDNFFASEKQALAVAGKYVKDTTTYFSLLITTRTDSSWQLSTAYDTSSRKDIKIWKTYSDQLFRCKTVTDGSDYFSCLYGPAYNYVFSITGENGRLDSIAQGWGINDVGICADSLLYASIRNTTSNFVVRKKGARGPWETMPIVIFQPGPLRILTNVFLGISLLLVVIAFFLYRAFINKGKEIKTEKDKPNEVYNQLKLAADKPLDYKQIKNKDTKDAIDAMVEVIENKNTPLPMTIAVNGAWGSGKSTIMNCIREKLDTDDKKRFITTWFNAWHQQNESSLLNAFLLKIINRYETPFFRNNSWKAGLAFFRFRVKLASSRFIKWPFYNQVLSGFALCFLLLVTVIVILNLYNLAGSDFFRERGLQNISLSNLFTDGNMKSLQTIASLMALILSVCSFFILRSEATPTIGAFLNVMYKKSFLVDAEKNSPDMREKFRTQYWEIMEAVEDRVLIVFIDDLDRVNGDKIFDMLEAINFISDVTSRPDDSDRYSLKTVFVLGLYQDQVAEQLGTFLQKDNANKEKNDPQKAKKDAILLGRQYLEKMIQLNVPVPLTGKDF